MRTTFDFTVGTTQRLGEILRDIFLTASDAVVFNPHALGVATQQALVAEGYAIAVVRAAEPDETLELPVIDAHAVALSQWRNPGLEALAAQRRAQGGFTLIEAMVTVALIAVLSMISAPVYTSYIARGKVAEAFNVSAAAQLAIADYRQANAAWPTGEAAAGVETLEGRGKYTTELRVDNGNIAVHFTTTPGDGLNDTWLVLRPAADSLQKVVWLCGAQTAPAGFTAAAVMTLPGSPAGAATPTKFLPSTCR